VEEGDAHIASTVLVEADLRGIVSHGVARLRHFYVNRIRDGRIVARPQVQMLTDTPATAVIDAGGGLGHPVSHHAMSVAIQKAQDLGVGFVAVRNSNHYGIAGYYATMALDHECIGMSMTNSSPLVVPTFGRVAKLGTNPIAVAAPAGNEYPYLLDMATSTVPAGKIEVYERREEALPEGWVIDGDGEPVTNAAQAIEHRRQRAGGGHLPLGGIGELLSGHKGYGLALWVEIFCALLSGAPCAYETYASRSAGKSRPSQVSHFFGAWRVDQFRPVKEFKATMDELQRELKDAPRIEGQSRIYVPGEKEYIEKDRRAHEGIPLNQKVVVDLQMMAEELGMDFDL
jgi:LDH2 family malate/lactate/ureidoglycolate dehydrogenase